MEQESEQECKKPIAYTFVGPDGPHFIGVVNAARFLGCSQDTLRSTLERMIAWPDRMTGQPPESLANRVAREFPRLLAPYRIQEEVPA